MAELDAHGSMYASGEKVIGNTEGVYCHEVDDYYTFNRTVKTREYKDANVAVAENFLLPAPTATTTTTTTRAHSIPTLSPGFADTRGSLPLFDETQITPSSAQVGRFYSLYPAVSVPALLPLPRINLLVDLLLNMQVSIAGGRLVARYFPLVLARRVAEIAQRDALDSIRLLTRTRSRPTIPTIPLRLDPGTDALHVGYIVRLDHRVDPTPTDCCWSTGGDGTTSNHERELHAVAERSRKALLETFLPRRNTGSVGARCIDRGVELRLTPVRVATMAFVSTPPRLNAGWNSLSQPGSSALRRATREASPWIGRKEDAKTSEISSLPSPPPLSSQPSSEKKERQRRGEISRGEILTTVSIVLELALLSAGTVGVLDPAQPSSSLVDECLESALFHCGAIAYTAHADAPGSTSDTFSSSSSSHYLINAVFETIPPDTFQKSRSLLENWRFPIEDGGAALSWHIIKWPVS